MLVIQQELTHCIAVWCSPWWPCWLHQNRLVDVGSCHGKWRAGKCHL